MNELHKINIFDLLLDFIELAIIGATIFLLVYLFVGQLLEVTGHSMVPALHDKEQVLAEKLSPNFKPLERGDIIVFRHPEEHSRLLIKRIIAMPEERLKISNGQIFINDNFLEEPYLIGDIENSYTSGHKSIEEEVEYRVPAFSYVLMGDNRKESSDSRNFGAVREELIVGRAFLVYYPLSNIRLIEH